jgi:hypothetical protein
MQKVRRLRSAPLSATKGAYVLAQALNADSRGLGYAPMLLGCTEIGRGSMWARFGDPYAAAGG